MDMIIQAEHTEKYLLTAFSVINFWRVPKEKVESICHADVLTAHFPGEIMWILLLYMLKMSLRPSAFSVSKLGRVSKEKVEYICYLDALTAHSLDEIML